MKPGDEKQAECPTHGVTTYVLRTDGRWRCRACNTDWCRDRRQDLKKKAIEYGGGACARCGYDKCDAALEFHHLDPSQKDFSFRTRKKMTWEGLVVELDKCVLLCANCHREVHAGIGPVPIREGGALSMR